MVLLTMTSSAQSFVERASDAGLRHFHRAGLDRVGYTGATVGWTQSGIGLGDLDGDFDIDVIAIGGLGVNHVFENVGGGQFIDVTSGTGMEIGDLDRSVTLGDYDGDGDLDVCITGHTWGDGKTRPRSRIYRNEGDFRFTETTHLTGSVGFGHTIESKSVDLDLDGLVDLYLGEFCGTANGFYRNNGDGSFTELGHEYGLDDVGSTHAVGVIDSDRNDLPNVFVGNDFGVSIGTLSQNMPDTIRSLDWLSAYVDHSLGSGAAQLATTMGISFGDVNYDGLLDMYKTEFGPNFLMINNGWPKLGVPWMEGTLSYGVQSDFTFNPNGIPTGRVVGWGTAFTHFDLDPWIDLVLVNGKVGNQPRDQVNTLWRGQSPLVGAAFQDYSRQWGFTEAVDDRALAIGDVDLDGDVDIFVGPTLGRLRYYENRLARRGQGWLKVVPLTKTSAPGGAGTIVEWVDSHGYPHVRPILADGTTAGQNVGEAFFGLGMEDDITVTVDFPSGVELRYTNVPKNSTLYPKEPELIRMETRTATESQAGNLFRVQAFAHDRFGTPLDGTANVTIDIPGLRPVSAVTHVVDNEFERYFYYPPYAGEYRVTVAFDTFTVRIRPRLIVTGSISASDSELVLRPASARANVEDKIRLLVTPKDNFGHMLGAGHSVDLEIEADHVVYPFTMVDLGDGSYACDVTLAVGGGKHPIRISFNGSPMSHIGEFEAGGTADPAMTLNTLYEEQSNPLVLQSMPETFRFYFIPMDEFGGRLGPNADIEVQVLTSPGSTDVTKWGRKLRSGEVYYLFSRAPNTPLNSAYGTYRVLVDGQLVIDRPFAF